MLIVPVILCGGIGSRLWPLSTPEKPKVFLPLGQHLSLYQDTLLRLAGFSRPVIVGNLRHAELLIGQSEDIECNPDIILEPHQRGTLPAAAVAAMWIKKQMSQHVAGGSRVEPVLLISPADHVIRSLKIFNCSVNKVAFKSISNMEWGLFAVKPGKPDYDYGFIATDFDHKRIIDFVEKPDEQQIKAQQQGNIFFYWNSGIFLVPLSVFLNDLLKYQPKVYMVAEEVIYGSSFKGEYPIVLNKKIWLDCPSVSIDQGIIEKINHRFCEVALFKWHDMGTWERLVDFSLESYN